MSFYTIGLSGIGVNQTVMDLIGQNLTNANDPAYHRQDAILAPLTFGASVGVGVKIAQVRRLISNALEAAINNNSSALNDATQQLQTLQQVQTTLAPSDAASSLTGLLESFFNQAQQLTTQPDDLTQRRVLLDAAQAVADQVNATAATLSQTRTNLLQQAQQTIDQVNQTAAQIATLNGEIRLAVTQNTSPNALEDQRDALIASLAQQFSLRTFDEGQGQTGVLIGGAPLALGDQSFALRMTVDSNQQAVILSAGSPNSVSISGGQLGAMLTVNNELLPQYQAQLSTFSRALQTSLDELQARGVGLGGPLTSLHGTRAATSVTAPLASAGLEFPPAAGTLSISITDLGSGQPNLPTH